MHKKIGEWVLKKSAIIFMVVWRNDDFANRVSRP